MKPKKINFKREYKRIPTQLTEQQFDKFILAHLLVGRRSPDYNILLYKVFNYILQLMRNN